MENEKYQDFIKKAFIDPIRSVLIIDDDYPTYDEILSNDNEKEEKFSDKKWHANRETVKNVIKKFRSPERALLVDIHDGTNIAQEDEESLAHHLHQSDLLILDFELDKSKPDDGEQAIKILRQLSANNHFNLVVIHTSLELDTAFNEIIRGLLKPCGASISEEKKTELEELIEGAEDQHEGLFKRLEESVTWPQYLAAREKNTNAIRNASKGCHPFENFKFICDEVGFDKDKPGKIIKYLLCQFEKTHFDLFFSGDSGLRGWSSKGPMWIHSDSLFIAFSKKETDEDRLQDADEKDLFEELQTALNEWNPQPPRLLMTKLRAEIDDYGIAAQGPALNNKYASAFWYDRLMNSSPDARLTAVAETVSRYSEKLLASIFPGVEDFAIKLIDAEVKNGEPADTVKNHFQVDLSNAEQKDIAEKEHNAHVCSKSPEGWHLTIGHIFKLVGDYWVCLSPACDIVPTQHSGKTKKVLGDNHLPFTAVKLIIKEKKPDDVQSNRHLFIYAEGGLKTLSLNGSPNSNPHWETLYAENLGKFSVDNTGNKYAFSLLRAEHTGKSMEIKSYDCRVVSQLRYEYALNLSQKLGTSMTRIGLDFAGQ